MMINDSMLVISCIVVGRAGPEAEGHREAQDVEGGGYIYIYIYIYIYTYV